MLRVLTYHRVAHPADSPELDPAVVSATPSVFEEHMRHVRVRYRPVSLADVIEAFSGGRPLPPRAVHVTFDDAYRDFARFAWPVLKNLEIPVTVFVPTAYPGDPDRAFWWDRLHRAVAHRARQPSLGTSMRAVVVSRDRVVRASLRQMPHDEAERVVDETCARAGLTGAGAKGSNVLSWEELRELKREGVTFGSHTRDHVALPYAGDDRIRSEIRTSLADIERELGERPVTLAYPYGSHDGRVARIAKEEGCVAAFTCEDGLSEPKRTDAMFLRRTNITPRTSPRVFPIRMHPWFANLDRIRHAGERRGVAM
jgi:peptidoglycan/xylan/chitin deacetylase (PgdA/CDA1 family)